jgi:uncharacterized protein
MTTVTENRSDVDNTTVSPSPSASKTRKVLLALALLLLLVIAIFAAIPPLVIGGMVNQHVAFSQTWTGAEHDLSPNRLELTTSDGYQIVAYEVTAEQPKAVIIFLSGIHNPSVTAFFGHARMLLDEGYASILLEMRAHGESEGGVIALGYEEYLDVQAVVDYIKRSNRYTDVPVVVYGLSMGGATAVNAIGQIAEIDGLISLSAFSAWDDVFVDNMGLSEPLASLQRPFVRLYTGFKYGFDKHHITPKQQIQNLGDRPALIIHSTDDSQVPFANYQRLMALAPDHVETWVRHGDLHFIVQDGHFLNPQEDAPYAARIIHFMDHHFGD